ncbi:hypothetical protein HYU13_05085 [Candidatus Woesearchaeota archaeon]|nr:hypothetical protein [Candidatus Woesearchaeota archaeon]
MGREDNFGKIAQGGIDDDNKWEARLKWLEHPEFDFEQRQGKLEIRNQQSLVPLQNQGFVRHVAKLEQALGNIGDPGMQTLARELKHGFPLEELYARGILDTFDARTIEIAAQMIYAIVPGRITPYIAQAAIVSWPTPIYVSMRAIGTRENNSRRLAYAEIEFAGNRPVVEFSTSSRTFSRDPDIRLLKHDGRPLLIPQAAGVPRMLVQDGLLRYS